ncbi:MAG: PilZ domain-containing protein [Nannocystaceae bacterium]|nr:PilZ domain-containing protein [Nannocystaceae bacterium]
MPESPAVGELRTTPRFEVDIAAAVTVDAVAYVGRICNLSRGGALIRVPGGAGLGVGGKVEVSFSLPELDAPLSARAEVRWVSQGDQDIVGVQFVTGFRAKETWALGRMFDRLRVLS